VRSADDPDDALSSVLAGLAVSARQANLARAEVIGTALTALGEGDLDEGRRAAARDAAHQVVGSAGTFGAHRASELAGSLENYLSADPQPAGLAQAQAQLAELRRELQADHQVEE